MRSNHPSTCGVSGFPGGLDSKESACNARDLGSIPGSGRSLREGNGTYSSILAWRTPMERRLEGYTPWGRKELDMTEQLNTAQNNFLITYILQQ